MIVVPSFLLKRLYVKGSFRNNDQGFQFELKNNLGSGYANELFPLTLDGIELPKDSSYFVIGNEEIAFTAVSKDKPFTLAKNKTSTILVKGTTLSEEPHKIGFSFAVQGLGKLGFEVADSVFVAL